MIIAISVMLIAIIVFKNYDNDNPFLITIGEGFKFDVVDNRYSEDNGATFVGIPITVKNIGNVAEDANGLLDLGADLYSSNGVESPTSYSTYFDDWNDLLYTKLRPGVSISGYIYI